jgi:hypothetical protein
MGRRYRKKKHWFDEECMEKRRITREAIRKFKGQDDDENRIEYWENRKAYERIVEKKRCRWQEKEAEYINKLVKGKEIKKIWEAIRTITGKKETSVFVEPREWISYFQELFGVNNNGALADPYERRTLGPLRVVELDSDFTRNEVTNFIRKMKNNKASGYDGIPAEFWKIFCTVRGGIEMLTNTVCLIKLKMEKNSHGTGRLLLYTQFIREREIEINLVTIEESRFYQYAARYFQ